MKGKTVDGVNYWMDPTVDHCRLGEVPYQDQGTTALVLDDDNTSTLQTIPSDRFNANIRDINMKDDLRNPAEAEFGVKISFRGQDNLIMIHFFADRTREDIAKFCKSLLADQSLDAKLADYSFATRMM